MEYVMTQKVPMYDDGWKRENGWFCPMILAPGVSVFGFLFFSEEKNTENIPKPVKITESALVVLVVLVECEDCFGTFLHQHDVHPGRLTWNLRITHVKRKNIFQTFIFGFHVKFRGCRNFLFRSLHVGDMLQRATT